MSTLHLDIKLGLSTDKTRTLLGEYSRGCSVDEVVYSPKIMFDPQESKYFSVMTSNTIVFLSDFFGEKPSFDICLIHKDDTITEFQGCNVFVIDTISLKAFKITNISNEVRRAHLIR